jgi:hypothetical protein
LKKLDVDLLLTGFEPIEVEGYLRGLDVGPTDAQDEWQGMPEYSHEDKSAFKTLVVHFPDQQSVDLFAKKIDQKITEKTKTVWFPPQEHMNTESKQYVQAEK